MPLFAWALLFMVASSVLKAFLVKPQKNDPASLEDFDFPQIDEGTSQAVFFGDCWTDGWMILFFGNLRSTKIKAGKK